MTQADGDGLPTMGQQAEADLLQFSCVCGSPSTPGVMHCTDRPCYHMETQVNNDDPVDNVPLDTRPPFLLRLLKERSDLDVRGQALSAFIRGDTEVAAGKSFKDLPERDRDLLKYQMQVMGNYYAVLTERILRAENPEQAAKMDREASALVKDGNVGSGGTDGNG